jgi:hypothetical protein
MSKSERARAKLYRNKSFRHELADGLGLAGIKVHVTSCLDALLETHRLPSRDTTDSRAAATDAALIVIAVGSMQTSTKAAVHMTDRLGTMKLSKVIDTSGVTEREIPIPAETDLVADLAAVFEEYWAAPDGAFVKGLCHATFMTTIADTPSDDAATLTRVSANRRHIYSAATTVEHQGVRTTRGGMTFMPSSLANFAEQLRHDLKGTAAALRGSRSDVGGVEVPSGSAENNDGIAVAATRDRKIVSSADFARILRDQVAGNLDATTALTLRFALLGRATVGGAEYHRDGGPSEEHNRFAKQVFDIGGLAVETAERHPEGWVVVDAFGRPWCRVKNGLSEFTSGHDLFVFESEEECTRFAERTNARSKNDPFKPVRWLSTHDFAREAVKHAKMWRRLCC